MVHVHCGDRFMLKKLLLETNLLVLLLMLLVLMLMLLMWIVWRMLKVLISVHVVWWYHISWILYIHRRIEERWRLWWWVSCSEEGTPHKTLLLVLVKDSIV